MPFPQAPRWLFVLKGVLALVAVGTLVWLADPSAVAAALAHANVGWMLAALALVPVNIGLEAYRWGRLVRRLAPDVRHRDVLRAVVGSYPLGLLTPGRIGDYVGRAVYLRDIPPGASAALTFGERMATLAACLVGGLVALGPYLRAEVAPSPLWSAVLAVGLAATAGLIGLILFPSLARSVVSTLVPFAPIRRAAEAFGQIPQEEGAMLLGLSAVRYVVFSGQFVLLAHALAPSAPVAGLWAGVALVFFAKSAIPQVTLGDLGVREGAAVFFLGSYGVAPAAALDASLALFALNLLLPAIVGAPFLVQLQLRRSADRTAQAEVSA
ncbi:lysylphosphatidylglycerol synthase transmembrane domain-containing protein [Rubrivirga sp. IMCC43871]|uniref:lysylphosphatidylglycerol synthase transmembrane domain-containing protein n=1 Tax=Rubrivirga sp. IMCC43871 TaxID=3391575 RepID=UPI003990379E